MGDDHGWNILKIKQTDYKNPSKMNFFENLDYGKMFPNKIWIYA